MPNALRLFTLTGLVLGMVVTALSVGHARGQARVAGEVVLCIGTQVVTVTVDADGQPVTSVQTCPDGILKLAAPLAPPVVVARPADIVCAGVDRPETTLAASVAVIDWKARAPPRLA
ncbi:hypothetical protein ACRDNQ_01065 [Palleronia sp. KMU-117]|uniref:hypothetical protein n=1 Tax=Palleronia sp. KMU-117 TaxID=3434108 RepID=UPI003D75B9B4